MSNSNSTKMDMSLDDIIRMKGPRRNNNNNRNNGFQQRRGRPQFNGNRNSFGNSGGGLKRLNNSNRNANGNRRFNNFGNNNNFSRPRFGESNGAVNGSFGQRSTGFSSGRRRNFTLHISNLALTVNSEDIDELFSTFGQLVRAYVHYDQHGSSLGTAEVVFEQRDESIEARNKLNNVPLDGLPLKITLIDEDDNDEFTSILKSSTQQRSRNNFQSRLGSRNSGDNNGGGRFNNNNRRNNNRKNDKVELSADDLDRELDEWRKNAEEEEGQQQLPIESMDDL